MAMARPAFTDGEEPAGTLGDGSSEQTQEAGEHAGSEEGRGIGCPQCTRNDYDRQGGEGRRERRKVRSERRSERALGMRAWTGWPIALGLTVALGPG